MQNDVTALLRSIQENIGRIEGGDASTSLLDSLRADFLELMELLKLFLISERDSYYGYFLMNMQFRVNFYSNSIAGIKLGEFPPVLEANPLLLCKFSLKEIIYVVCHEIDHVVLNHPAEMLKANPEGDEDVFKLFNYAADAAVNDRIDYEIKREQHGFMAPPAGVITSRSLSQLFQLGRISAMEHYAYYFDLLMEKYKKVIPQSLPKNGQSAMLVEEAGVEEGPAEQSAPDGENGQAPVTAARCGGQLIDHDWQAGSDSEDAAAAVRELVNASVSMMDQETRGLMSRHFMSQVEKLNQPAQLPWQAILKKYVGTITAGKQKTRRRLNRRQPERFDLSGVMDYKVLKIVVAIDTSASVNDRMISSIFNEIFDIVAKRKHEITVIECDAEVQRVYKARTRADIQKKVTGRGGTSFSPVIEYINKDPYYRDALLIYFTDGYGETKIPKPRTYRNLWVVFERAANLSVKEPYGMVLSF